METIGRIFDEELYFRYIEREIAIHSIPDPILHFDVKFRNGKIYTLSYCIDIMMIALRCCIPMTREQYDAF